MYDLYLISSFSLNSMMVFTVTVLVQIFDPKPLVLKINKSPIYFLLKQQFLPSQIIKWQVLEVSKDLEYYPAFFT